MKHKILISILIFLISFNINAQEEGGGVIKLSFKTTPVLVIEKVTFFDENKNKLIEAGENCYFQLEVKNTGKTAANKPIIETTVLNNKNLNLIFEKTTNINKINPGKSVIIKIPVTGSGNLKTSFETIAFTLSDAGKYKSKQVVKKINTIEASILLTTEWIFPLELNTTVNEEKVNLKFCVKSEKPLTKVLIYVNNKLQQIARSFTPSESTTCNYTVEKKVNLKEGENEIKLKITAEGKTITSEERIITFQHDVTEYRNALVIGNSDYTSAPLANPINDAKAMAKALRKLNFDVIELIDADKKTMRDSIRAFKTRMEKDRGVGLFYYAGHGVQVNGENYLIPIKHSIQFEYDVPDEAIRVSTVLAYMQDTKSRMNIVILDACRDNPLPRSMRSGSRGLATIYAKGGGSIIAYATSPGSTASDGSGENGLYTQELLKAIKTPGLEIGMVFRHVLGNVQKISKGKQIPWTNSSIVGEFYFTK